MKDIFGIIGFKDEARLLHARVYIIKAALTVITAYAIAALNPLLKLDTISILFGAVMTLEPVTLTGIRSGLNQLYSSLIGGVSTAIIISLFGINSITMALSVAFTLYICLKINWREVSPVAIFTSIYMTQYIQKNALGEPSILLTLQLRFAALGFGVLIAVIFNLLFAMLSYRSIVSNRIAFLLSAVISKMERLETGLKEKNIEMINDIMGCLPPLFNTIDWVFYMFEDMKKEHRIKQRFNTNKLSVDKLQNIVSHIRTITHLNYDICYAVIDEKKSSSSEKDCISIVSKGLSQATCNLREIRELFNGEQFWHRLDTMKTKTSVDETEMQCFNSAGGRRMISDIIEIEENISGIIKEIHSLGLNARQQ